MIAKMSGNKKILFADQHKITIYLNNNVARKKIQCKELEIKIQNIKKNAIIECQKIKL